MDLPNPFPQFSYALQKSLGLWLSIWAVRFSAGVDYKLSVRGRTIRWLVVVLCFSLTSMPGAGLGWFRLSSYLLGLAFLCWPNIAYHLSKLFDEWPIAEGRVDSVQQRPASRWTVAYDFEMGGERYGGHDTVKFNGVIRDCSEERIRVLVRYDPLNPGRSSRIERISAN